MAKEVVPGNPGAPFAKAVKISGMMFTSGNCAAGDGIQANWKFYTKYGSEVMYRPK